MAHPSESPYATIASGKADVEGGIIIAAADEDEDQYDPEPGFLENHRLPQGFTAPPLRACGGRRR